MIRTLVDLVPFLWSFKSVRGLGALLAAALACFGVVWATSSQVSTVRRETEQQIEQVVTEKDQVRTRIQTNATVTAKPQSEQAEDLMRWAQ